MLKWIWSNISNIDSVINIIINLIKGIVFIGGIISGLIISFLRLKLKHNQYKYLNLAVDSQVKQAMQYYIPTRGQNIDPCVEEEYTTRHSFVSVELVRLFIKEIFRSSEMQYYISGFWYGKNNFFAKIVF